MDYPKYEKEISELIKKELSNYPQEDIDFVDRIIISSGFHIYIDLDVVSVPKEKVIQVINETKKFISNYSKNMPRGDYHSDWDIEKTKEDLKNLNGVLKLIG